VPARRRDIHIADVDRAAQEGDEVGRALKEGRETGRPAIRHDDLAALRMLGEGLGIEHLACRVDHDLRHLAQRRDGALAVVVAQHLGAVGEKYARHVTSSIASAPPGPNLAE
jgi:hypothetical protein